MNNPMQQFLVACTLRGILMGMLLLGLIKAEFLAIAIFSVFLIVALAYSVFIDYQDLEQ